MNKIEEYIKNGWNECIKSNKEDSGTLVGLPYPYTVPAVGTFDEIYYWDTYFTNIGLIISGMTEQAKFNIDNMLYLIDKYGFMPNGNRTYYLNRSQPPFLSEMVSDVYNVYKDNVWLASSYNVLCKEYDFWMTQRNSPTGLNLYGGDISVIDHKETAGSFKHRVKKEIELSDTQLAKHCMLSCESGWDLNPRWEYDGYNYNHIDLNALLYQVENNMKKFADILGYTEDAEKWEERINRRKELMNKYMLSPDGLFLDNNFENGTFSNVFSVASYYTMYVGLATEEQAETLVKNLHRLEMPFGIATCEKGDAENSEYQWDYPNGWACLQYIVVEGLRKYGYNDDADRIAEKYIKLTEKVFEETGNLWEKYNVSDGSINVTNEYEMPAMMGWSAGIYLALKK